MKQLLLALAVVAVINGSSFSDDRPNVILIVADDLGYADLGCYGGEIQTPNLDRLAAAGLRFARFYNSHKCEPTRASSISGQYWQNCGLGIGQGITMGQAMRTAGYATFACGKWHLRGNPLDRGFDHYFGHLSGGSDYFRGNPSHRLDDQPFKPQDDTFYTTDAQTKLPKGGHLDFAVTHDGEWHTHPIAIDEAKVIYGFRLDPGAGPGKVVLEGLTLKSSTGAVLCQWP